MACWISLRGHLTPSCFARVVTTFIPRPELPTRIEVVRQALAFITNAEFMGTIHNPIFDVDLARAVFCRVRYQFVENLRANRLDPSGWHLSFVAMHFDRRFQDPG